MNSARRSFSKPPPSASESFESFKAAKEIFCDLTYQIRCLNELYNQLTPQSGNHRRASSSSSSSAGDPKDKKVLQKLRELKANLRSNYGDPLLLPPNLKVVVMFDEKMKAFFDIRLRPRLGYPTGYPFFIDDSEGTIAGLSEVIYRKVLKAVQEEEEEPRGFGEGNHNNSHAAEDLLEPVNIKQEVVDDEEEEEEEELIPLIEDSDEEHYDNELQQEENYNSQMVIPPPDTDNSGLSGDCFGSAVSAAAAASSFSEPAIAIPPENADPAVNGSLATDTDTTTTTTTNNNTSEQHCCQQSVSVGSAVSQGQSESAPIKLEPADSSTITRVSTRPPTDPQNRAPQKPGHDEAAAAASSVPVPPPPAADAANAHLLQVNSPPPNPNLGPPSKSKPQPLPLPPPNNNNNNGTTTSAQQRQQQLPATAAAVAEERGTLKKMKPTGANSNINQRCIVNNNNNNKRPADHSNAAQPQGNPKRAKVFAGTSSSTQATRATSRAASIAGRFLASAAFRSAAEAQKLDCPLCERRYVKAAMGDHLDMCHINRGRYVFYRCTAPGCRYTNGYGMNAREHARREHGGEQYIVKAAAAAGAAVVPTARTVGSPPLASGSAAEDNRATITTTAATTSTPSATTTTTTAATTSTHFATTTTGTTTSTPPSATSTPQQQQQHQQHRPSTSTWTPPTAANIEEYLRAHCPGYAATKNATHTRLECPQCSKSLIRCLMKDHYLAVHRGLKPYHCLWPGCRFTNGWRRSAARHVKEVHRGSSYAHFIVYRKE